MTEGNGIKLENRLATMENEIKHIADSVANLEKLMEEHNKMDAKFRMDMTERVTETEAGIDKNRLWLRVLIWALSVGVSGSGIGALLKAFG